MGKRAANKLVEAIKARWPDAKDEPPAPAGPTCVIRNTDCIAGMADLPPACVDLVVTSIP